MLFDKETYVARRDRLRRQVGSGLVLLFGNNDAPANYPANAYKFRQDSSFLYFYGLLYNFDKLTLRVKNDGCFLSKTEKGWFDSSTPWHLSVENPIDPSLDVGKASYHIKVGLRGAMQ